MDLKYLMSPEFWTDLYIFVTSPSFVAGLVLTVALFAYIFWPERNPFVQADKTRVDYLRERKDAIYENLRDLNFEFQAGKYPEADYNQQRSALEDEAAQVISEMEALMARGMKSTRAGA
jgi:hypothetical protein